VKARFFEETHRERQTAASMLVALGTGSGPENASTITTDHVEIRAWATDQQVRPGTKVSLVLDMTPRARMHLYAPGNRQYKLHTRDPDARAAVVGGPRSTANSDRAPDLRL